MNEYEICLAAKDRWKTHPLECIRTLFTDSLTPQQEQIPEAVANHKDVYVVSSHGLGKSHASASVALQFLYTYYPEVQVLTIAPTWSQVEDILWVEIGKLFRNSLAAKNGLSLGGTLMKTRLELSGDCFAVGLSPRLENDDEGQRITGRHCKNQLVILDEAHGIDPRIWDYVDMLRTGANSRLLAIGNASKMEGNFYSGLMSPYYKHIKLNIFESPNFLANGITDEKKLKALFDLPPDKLEEFYRKEKTPYPAISTVQWAIERARKWGWDSPVFQSRVLCKFISRTSDTLISLPDLEACASENKCKCSIKALGVDPSRVKDRTVLFGLKDFQECFRLVLPGQDLTKLRNIITKHAIDNKFDVIAIDIGGLGVGLYDMLVESRKSNNKIPRILPVNFGVEPTGAYIELVTNLISELWYRASKLVEKRELVVYDKDTLYAELTNRKYDTDKLGKIAIEDKKKYKKRVGGESPDIADALLLSLAGIFYGSAKTAGLQVWGERAAGNLEYNFNGE